MIDRTPRTLGTVAERNDRRAGRYGLEEIHREQKERRKVADEEAAKSLPAGANLVRSETAPAPWRGGDGPNLGLANLTPDQRANYIRTGDSRG